MNSTTEHVYTPTELNREAKLHLEAGFPRILLEAEVSNLARPASGHLYFSLKDDRAQVRCAMFKSAASRSGVVAENGMKVQARGRISLYEPRGEYQFIVDGLQEAGEGLLQRQFEELKRKLDSEGLFDPIRKQKLPGYPGRIGLVTSPGGAAVRDLLHVLERRWPLAEVRLYPVLVQGINAPAEIRKAILAANRQQWADLLIVGRGGGSLEDLAAFNDEALARAVFASDIPVISAVGHETDFSICDFVADLRAPTPSAAAELATPDQRVLKDAYHRFRRQLEGRISDRLQNGSQRLDHAGHRLKQQHPASRLVEQSRHLQSLEGSLARIMKRSLGERRLELENLSRRHLTQHPSQRLADLSIRVAATRRLLDTSTQRLVRSSREKLAELARTLNAVSPLETLGRGYAIVSDKESGEVISSVRQLTAGDRISTRLTDGVVESSVETTESIIIREQVI
jgi:exodeoxyribonuclease VII large subunit